MRPGHRRFTEEDYAKAYAALAVRGRGQHNALHGPALARAIGMDYDEGNSAGNGGGAYLRKLIGLANRAGYLICSCEDGYYIPATSAEAIQTANRLRSTARTLIERATRVEQMAARYFGPHQQEVGL